MVARIRTLAEVRNLCRQQGRPLSDFPAYAACAREEAEACREGYAEGLKDCADGEKSRAGPAPASLSLRERARLIEYAGGYADGALHEETGCPPETWPRGVSPPAPGPGAG